MRRILFLGLAVIGLLGAGCRSCGDRPRLLDRLAGRGRDRDETPVRSAPSRADCCPDGYPTATRQSGSPTIIGTPVGAWPGEMGFPVYPNGTPYPITPGGARPANELPYPNILPPGVPESPAQPMPAVPGGTTGVLPAPGARTTGDGKGK